MGYKKNDLLLYKPALGLGRTNNKTAESLNAERARQHNVPTVRLMSPRVKERFLIVRLMSPHVKERHH